MSKTNRYFESTSLLVQKRQIWLYSEKIWKILDIEWEAGSEGSEKIIKFSRRKGVTK